jgi:hypothetical protein
MKRKIVALAIALLTLSAIAGTQPASADTQAATHRILNYAYGFCLDSNFDGAAYVNRNCPSGNLFQKWVWTGTIPSEGTIRNANTRLCLDSNGTSVYTLACNSGVNQRWRVIKPAGAGLPWIYNLAAGKCLAVDSSAHLLITTCRVDTRYLWRFVA